MRRLLTLLVAAFALLATGAPALAAPKTETAVFAGGCFWCMEHDMQGVPGVLKVESGYTGGHLKNPTYRDVTSETSGHYEAVRVTYDPAKLDYGFLLYRYWKLVDPTDDGASSATGDRPTAPPCSSRPPSAQSPRSPARRPPSA